MDSNYLYFQEKEIESQLCSLMGICSDGQWLQRSGHDWVISLWLHINRDETSAKQKIFKLSNTPDQA